MTNPNPAASNRNNGTNTSSQRSSRMVRPFEKLVPVAMLIVGLAGSSTAVADDLYLIIGQSNAAGRDTNIRSNNADASDSDVQLFNDENRFEIANQPLNQYSTVRNINQNQGVNFGLEFGIEMHADNGQRVHLVVNARGGTSVAEWREQNRDLFDPTVERVRAAESACDCELTGILWHQGEANTRDDSFTSGYLNSLEGLIAEFRAEFGNVPFIVGEIARSSDNRALNQAIRTVDDNSFGPDDVEWARSAGLDTFDGTHFDSSSIRTLGRRYANRMQQFID